jgi:hypothetical protein
VCVHDLFFSFFICKICVLFDYYEKICENHLVDTRCNRCYCCGFNVLINSFIVKMAVDVEKYTWWRSTLEGIPFLGSLFQWYYARLDSDLEQYIGGSTTVTSDGTVQTKPLSWFQKLIRTVATVIAVLVLVLFAYLLYKIYVLIKNLFK